MWAGRAWTEKGSFVRAVVEENPIGNRRYGYRMRMEKDDGESVCMVGLEGRNPQREVEE